VGDECAPIAIERHASTEPKVDESEVSNEFRSVTRHDGSAGASTAREAGARIRQRHRPRCEPECADCQPISGNREAPSVTRIRWQRG